MLLLCLMNWFAKEKYQILQKITSHWSLFDVQMKNPADHSSGILQATVMLHTSIL